MSIKYVVNWSPTSTEEERNNAQEFVGRHLKAIDAALETEALPDCISSINIERE